MENSNEPEILPPITICHSQTAYSKLVVPASMRSQYWRYFGFPADEANNIITRTKIVCCICRRQIAYNKNTTNMSTHLIARHIDIMEKYFPNDIRPTSSRAKRSKLPKTSQTSTLLNKRMKFDELESEQWSDDGSFTKDRVEIDTKTMIKPNRADENTEVVRVFVSNENDELIETLDYSDCQGIYGLDSPNFSADEPEESNDHDFMNEEYLLSNVNADNGGSSQVTLEDGDDESKIKIDVYVDKGAKKSPKKAGGDVGAGTARHTRPDKEARETSKRLNEDGVATAIKNYIVSKVQTPLIFDEVEFRTMLKAISNRSDIPDSSKIVEVIENDFKQKSAASLLEIESLGKDVWYSLAFDKWTSKAGAENIIISFNYLTSKDGHKHDTLKRQIVNIVNGNCPKYLNKQFKDLAKCSVAVTNWELNEKDPLRVFLEKKKIPIIQSFSSVLEIIVNQCFELDEVLSTFTLLAELKDDAEERILSPCWLLQFNRLSELCESKGILSDERLMNIVNAITDCLRPLKNCLDILSEEATTWVSMMKPLAHSLISEHYSVEEAEDDGKGDIGKLVRTMKTIIADRLKEKITSNWFLTVASFLDPRFHGIATQEDRERIQSMFSKESKNGNKLSAKAEPEAVTPIKNEAQKRNSLLSLFASLPVGQNSKIVKNRIETEIRGYTEDVNADIDQCPLSWWAGSDTLYPNLHSHVHQYFSAPSFVNEIHRLPLAEQAEFREKFRNIKNEIDCKIMWLHMNS